MLNNIQNKKMYLNKILLVFVICLMLFITGCPDKDPMPVYHNWTHYTTSNSGLSNDYIRAIAIDNNNNIWIATQDGLDKFDGTNWTNYAAPNSNLQRPIAVDNNNNIWITARRVLIDEHQYYGLYKFDGSNWTNYNTTNSELSRDGVSAIAVDNNNNIWIGTSGFFGGQAGGGLNKFDGTNWTNYTKSNSGLSNDSNNVSAIAVDKNDNIWIGCTHGGGLDKFDGTNWINYNESNTGCNIDSIRVISVDNNNNIWIFSRYGGRYAGPFYYDLLNKFDGINWINWDLYYLRSLNIYVSSIDVVSIDKNNNIWFSSGVAMFSGVVKFDGTNWTHYTSSNSGFSGVQIATGIAIDNSNNVWLGTNNGIFVYKQNE